MLTYLNVGIFSVKSYHTFFFFYIAWHLNTSSISSHGCSLGVKALQRRDASLFFKPAP